VATGERKFTPVWKIKWPEIEQLCMWIKSTWALMLDEKRFKKCGISDELHGMEATY
jgi:hypothetical protein